MDLEPRELIPEMPIDTLLKQVDQYKAVAEDHAHNL